MTIESEISAKLGTLKAAELRRIQKTCEFFLKHKPTIDQDHGSVNERLLFKAVIRTLRRHNAFLPPDMLLVQWPPRVQGFTQERWEPAVQSTDAFIEKYLNTIPEKNKAAVYQGVVGMVVDWCVQTEETKAGMRLKFLARKVKSCIHAESLQFQFESAIEDACAELRKRNPLSIPRVLEALVNPVPAVRHNLPGYDSKAIEWFFQTMVANHNANDTDFP